MAVALSRVPVLGHVGQERLESIVTATNAIDATDLHVVSVAVAR